MIFIGAYLSVFMLIGHLVFGIPWYLKPILKSDADIIPKTVMHAVFHYITIVLAISAVALVTFAHNLLTISPDVVRFIGIGYILFGLTQIVLVVTSSGFKGLIKMFQWTMFLPIGILALLAVGF